MLTAVLPETVHETRLKVLPPLMEKPPPCTRESKERWQVEQAARKAMSDMPRL